MQEEMDKCRTDRDSHWNELTALKKSVAGIQGDAKLVREKLAISEQEVENGREQIGRLSKQLTKIADERDEAQLLVNSLRKQVDDLSKTIGRLNIDLAKCQSGQEPCTLFTLFKKLWKR